MHLKFDIRHEKKMILDIMQCYEDNPNYEKYSRIYDEVILESLPAIEPVGYYSATTHTRTSDEPYDQRIYCLVTLGEDIDHAIKTYFDNNEYLKGMLLNTLGDQILFDTTVSLSKYIDKEYAHRGIYLSKRHEPGNDYIAMDVQEEILHMLHEEVTPNITLTSGYMFSPQKTLSFYYGAASDLTPENTEHNCNACSAITCSYRKITLTVIDGGSTENILVLCGTNLLEALRTYGYHIPAYCNGRGSCGKCKVMDVHGQLTLSTQERQLLTEQEITQGIILACFHRLNQDTIVSILQDGSSTKILSDYELGVPPITHYHIVPIGGITENPNHSYSATKLIERQYGHSYKYTFGSIKELSMLENLAQDFYLLTRHHKEVVRVQQAPPTAYGIGVDMGTTTLVLTLVDLLACSTIDTYKVMNPQGAYGADVISRIQHDIKDETHIQTTLMREAITLGMITLMKNHQLTPEEIVDLTISGNTTMQYLLLGLNPYKLSVSPFTTMDTSLSTYPYPQLFDHEFNHLDVTLLPSISAYIGSDITSGFYYCDLLNEKGNILFVDIGTNGEMGLKTENGILCASTAAGPAFEGANIKCGMASTHGAMNHIHYDQGRFHYEVIGNVAPHGICGSALVDIVAELLNHQFMDITGKMLEQDAVTLYEDVNHKVAIYQEDIRQLQLAKSAIAAGLSVLVEEAGLTLEAIDKLYLAGGFGSHLNIGNAVAIGLIPEVLEDKVCLVGNSALGGCAKYMTDIAGRQAFEAIKQSCTYIELSTNLSFNDAYINNMFF